MVKRRPPDASDNPGNYGIAYEDVSFSSRYKVQLRGWWLPAREATGHTIIFCHGQNGSMEGDLPQAIPLHEAGYNILMFNLRAHGTSEGSKVTFGAFEKEDLLGAIDFVVQEKGVQRVAVMGFSMGAAVAMIAAALTDKIAVLVLDGVFLRFITAVQAAVGQTLPKPLAYIVGQLLVLGATVSTNTRMYQVSPLLWAKHIPANIPVLFIHGEKDPIVKLSQVERLAQDLQSPHKVWVAPDSQHREAFKKHREDYQREVLNWLAEHYLSAS